GPGDVTPTCTHKITVSVAEAACLQVNVPTSIQSSLVIVQCILHIEIHSAYGSNNSLSVTHLICGDIQLPTGFQGACISQRLQYLNPQHTLTCMVYRVAVVELSCRHIRRLGTGLYNSRIAKVAHHAQP